ncbi:MAG: heat shock protein HtpX [Planctomycetaceae bacterium]|nr:heat shock protein HtpX [Planctomycetaceae bacterium]
MPTLDQGFTKLGFVKTFVLPALLVFLIPLIAYAFFWHAQARFDSQARETLLQQVRSDQRLSVEERDAAVAFFTKTPFSQLILDEQVAINVDPQMRFYYDTFRWMLRLALLSIICGIAVFLLAGICVLVSLRSQFIQYLSLTVGWHVLRIYGALQTIVLGILIVSLSYWVTALWFNKVSLKLIAIAGILAIAGVCVVLRSIFASSKSEFHIEGSVLGLDSESGFSQELKRICEKLGTSPPDQIIAGVDDNFFVTEQAVTVDGKPYSGKTLFVSLPLLKQMSATEAQAVLAHEMAHFSGQDTLYSKKISPVLVRYQTYLNGLYEGVISQPVFYFMVCFRAMFELSLSQLRRRREFRADKIAAELTSPQAVAAAVLRISAYSQFRRSVEIDLFLQNQALEAADVSARIERGFSLYALGFVLDKEIGNVKTAHPFDSHPPLQQRLSAQGIGLNVDETQALLAKPVDGSWYHIIPQAVDLERQQWQAYEERFRQDHEESLPYRLMPESVEELAIVVRSFPSISFMGTDGSLSMDYQELMHSKWPDAIQFSEIVKWLLEKGVLEITFRRATEKCERQRSINTNKFEASQQSRILAECERYYGRYLSAVDFQRQVQAYQSTQAIKAEHSQANEQGYS